MKVAVLCTLPSCTPPHPCERCQAIARHLEPIIAYALGDLPARWRGTEPATVLVELEGKDLPSS